MSPFSGYSQKTLRKKVPKSLVNVCPVCFTSPIGKQPNEPKGTEMNRKAQALHIRNIVDTIKTLAGCESCGYNAHACALQFDHIDPSTKYRTRNGNLVHPADMVKGARYSLTTILAEISKCRILCANCHAV